MASGASPASIAARKTVSFAMNPAVGGTPARDTMNSDIAAARPGWRSERPDQEERSSPAPLRASRRQMIATTPKAPMTVAADEAGQKSRPGLPSRRGPAD